MGQQAQDWKWHWRWKDLITVSHVWHQTNRGFPSASPLKLPTIDIRFAHACSAPHRNTYFRETTLHAASAWCSRILLRAFGRENAVHASQVRPCYIACVCCAPLYYMHMHACTSLKAVSCFAKLRFSNRALSLKNVQQVCCCTTVRARSRPSGHIREWECKTSCVLYMYGYWMV